MKNLILVLTVICSTLVMAQKDDYGVFLENAMKALDNNDKQEYLANMKIFSAATEEYNITPENISQKYYDLYTKALIKGIYKDIEYDNDIASIAYKFVIKRINSNDKPDDLIIIGNLYQFGKGGVSKSFSKAEEYYMKACNQRSELGCRQFNSLRAKRGKIGFHTSKDSIDIFDMKHKIAYYLNGNHLLINKFNAVDKNAAFRFIFAKSFVVLYDPKNSLLFPDNYLNSFSILSQGKPHNVESVVAFGNTKKFKVTKHGKSRKSVIAQIQFNLETQKFVNITDESHNQIKFVDYDNLKKGTQTYYYGVPFQKAKVQKHIDLIEIHVGFCGDGILDNSQETSLQGDIYKSLQGNEECDPKDLNEKQWGKKGCSNTCKRLN